MQSEEVELHLSLDEMDADNEQLDDLTLRLLCNLQDLGAESVEREAGGALPEGAKGGDPFTLGALVLVAAPAFLPKLIEFLGTWVNSNRCTVKVKTPAGLEVEFPSKKRLSQDEVLALVKELTQIKEA